MTDSLQAEGRGSAPSPAPAGEGRGFAPSPAPAGEGRGEGRRSSARHWRIVGGTAATLLVIAALLITALRIAIAYLPEHADRLRTWVEHQTHTRIEYSQLDARLRWYGPEVVLRGVRVLDEDGTQALFTAREGSVGLDLWNFLRTGQFVAGRVHMDRARVTLVRLADGRIRLLGLAERPADQPPFDFDRLPAGRVLVENATVVYRDLMTGRPPLELRKLAGELRRDRDYVRLQGSARLPEALGSTAEFDVRLKGSLDEREHLDARVELNVDDLRLAGLADFVPRKFARPLDGRGPVRAVLAIRQGEVANLRLGLNLRDAAFGVPSRDVPPVEVVSVTEPRLELAPGNFMRHPTVTKTMLERSAESLPAEVRLDALAGDLRLRREGRAWVFHARELHVEPPGTAAREPARIAGRWWGRAVSRFGLTLDAEDVDVQRLWPLALALAPPAFDRWAGLAPTGRVEALHVVATRERAGLPPTFKIDADVRALGVNAHGRVPGIAGLTARVDGTEQRGSLRLDAESVALDWPRVFRQPIRMERVDADVTWRREGETWLFTTTGARLKHAQARATLDAQLQFVKPSVSPVLDLEAGIEDIDVAAVPRFIPAGRLRERTIAWLDRAFVRGSASNGRLSYHGPVRKFPFRHGEGSFTASADAQGVTLDYYPGFAPLTRAAGRVVFRNASIEADLVAGDIGGVPLEATTFAMSDYKAPVLDIDARGSGDVQKALAYVQGSPLGPRIGKVFMGLRGNGPARYDVALVLPIMSNETRASLGVAVPERDYLVRATLAGVDVSVPALRAPAQRVTGVFELHNEQVTVPSLRGTILDGPFEMEARPGRTTREVTASVDLKATGRAAGGRLPAFIGLPTTVRMTGTADWELRGRIEKRGEGNWPLTFDVTSSLVGLEVAAPRPFAKAPPEARPTHVRIEIPGQRPVNDVTLASGTARATLRFAEKNGQWRLDRGTARFDGQPVSLGPQPGLLVAGAWPQFDLGEWLALGDTPPRAPQGAQGQRLMDWLGPVDVQLERATVFGFEFRDVVAKLRGEGDAWRIGVSGPHAEGQVTVPDELARGRPIVLDMKRLHLLGARDESTSGTSKTAAQTDPRKLPAITAHADEFVWQARRFGRLDAVLTRDPRGLTIETLDTTAPAFTIRARGSWYVETGAPRTRIEGTLDSTDFGAAAGWLGYRDAVDARKARLAANLWWPGGPTGEAIKSMNGTLRLVLEEGQLRDVEPGAGRMLGLLSVAQLPRRLALDFRDVTDQGLAFDSVKGDFEVRAGNAFTQNLLLKGPAVNIGIVGRTGLASEDYDQTVVVSGNTSGPLAVAGALAAGPVVGAGVLVLSQLFKDQLQGLARVYYHVSGPWSAPVVERISGPAAGTAPTAQADARASRSQP
ncbi:MAG TPA: YhdP family protein [Steroidobacteraceae bacterium]|nr:YhdP family protein [Steroidobacteraceae bacterium]